MKKYDNKRKGFKVEYRTRGLDIGRQYAEGSLSLQNFKKNIRETLVYDTHDDIDIDNCHFVLLTQYCEKNNIVCKEVNDYVNFRNKKLQELMDTFKISRKVAKQFVIIILYGGKIDYFCQTQGFDLSVELPRWVVAMEEEMGKITKMVCSLNEQIYNGVKKLRKDEYKNKEASCLSYVLQQIEDDIIMNVVTKLHNMGFVVDTLCCDGVLIRKNNITEDTLEEVSSYCYDRTGYNVNFSIKPMERHYETMEKQEYDFSDFDFKRLG